MAGYKRGGKKTFVLERFYVSEDKRNGFCQENWKSVKYGSIADKDQVVGFGESCSKKADKYGMLMPVGLGGYFLWN